MNSCNTIRSVELLYYYSYYYWCTYILARYTRFSLLLYYLNLLSCLLWFSIFLVYISCFAFFLIQFNFPTTFFQKTVTQIYHIFPMRNSLSFKLQLHTFKYQQLQCSQIIMQKMSFVTVSFGKLSIVFCMFNHSTF